LQNGNSGLRLFLRITIKEIKHVYNLHDNARQYAEEKNERRQLACRPPPFILALVHSAGRTYFCETHSSPAVGGFFPFLPLFISEFSALLTFPLINRCVRLD
jgi:hypothetical protein